MTLLSNSAAGTLKTD